MVLSRFTLFLDSFTSFLIVLDDFGSFYLVPHISKYSINSNIAFMLAEQTFNVHNHAQNPKGKNTLHILRSDQFVLNRNSANTQNLEFQKSIDIARV